MNFTNTLIKGKLVKRYKRFFADIEVNNKVEQLVKTTDPRFSHLYLIPA